jgi:hypothetical protein
MLMICWFGCGPRVKRENGTVTAMPGCRTKLELRRKKKMRRNITSSSGKT